MTGKPINLGMNERVECAETLPSCFYTDPAVLALEKKHIFRRTWQLVGTLSQACGGADGAKRTIADPGAFFTVDVIGEPVVVVRDNTGTLRAFSNVCRHRAGPIAQGSGCRSVFNCAYHGWTYTLDGRLIGTPEVDGMEFFDRSRMGMIPLRCETWEQFVFVNFDPEAPPLSAFLENIPKQAAGFEFKGIELAERRDYYVNCNWKVYVDNYLEGYHIPIVHPGLMKEIDYPRYQTEVFRYSSQLGPVKDVRPGDAADRGYAPGPKRSGLLDLSEPDVEHLPRQHFDEFDRAAGHDRTLTIFEWYFHDLAAEKVRERVRKTIGFSETVQEDTHICEAVQRGLQSSTYDRGRYSVKRENGVHHFHLLLSEFLQST
jgi:choline monooxygenase